MEDEPLRKINYFTGFFLQANDLKAAEDYRDRTRWLHNLLFHGPGVVRHYRDQMRITVNDLGNEITVGTGFAIDPQGRELILWQPSTHPIRRETYDPPKTLYISISYQSREIDQRRNDSNPDYSGHAFIEESAAVAVGTTPPGPTSLELGRIALTRDGVRVRVAGNDTEPRDDEIDTRNRLWSGIARAVLRLDDYAEVVRSGEIQVRGGDKAVISIEHVTQGDRARVFSISVYPQAPGRIMWHQESSSDQRGTTEYSLVLENPQRGVDVLARYKVYRLG